jgi:CelD/BcsL family acetyltransferase involved in cellulose biosynthesis
MFGTIVRRLNDNKNWQAAPPYRDSTDTANPGHARGDLHFRIFRGRSGLAVLRDAWLTLEATPPDLHFYQSYNWYECLLTYLADDHDQYLFVMAARQDTVAAIFPFKLETERQFGAAYRVLDLPIHPHVTLRGAALHPGDCDRHLFDALIGYLERLDSPDWDVLRIHRVPADSPIDNLCRTSRSPLRVSWPSGSISAIACEDQEGGLAHVSARFRRNLRRLRKRSSGHGPAKLITCRGADALQQGLALFLEVEHDSWKSVCRSSVASEETLVNFYTSLSQARGETYECQINLLQIGNETIAVQFGIRSRDTFFVLKIGHRQAFARIGPGNMLMSEAIRHFAADPDIRFVNLTTAPPWADKWKSHSIPLTTHCIFRRSWAGITICVATRIKGLIDRWEGANAGLRG